MENKFIPGDLVMYKGMVCKIISSCNTDKRHAQYSIACIDDILPSFKFVHTRNISPIPLSVAILDKNGWYGTTHSKQSDDNSKILYVVFKRKGYPTIKVSQDMSEITCELSPFIVRLESVSDLQHLLFGLQLNSEIVV